MGWKKKNKFGDTHNTRGVNNQQKWHTPTRSSGFYSDYT